MNLKISAQTAVSKIKSIFEFRISERGSTIISILLILLGVSLGIAGYFKDNEVQRNNLATLVKSIRVNTNTPTPTPYEPQLSPISTFTTENPETIAETFVYYAEKDGQFYLREESVSYDLENNYHSHEVKIRFYSYDQDGFPKEIIGYDKEQLIKLTWNHLINQEITGVKGVTQLTNIGHIFHFIQLPNRQLLIVLNEEKSTENLYEKENIVYLFNPETNLMHKVHSFDSQTSRFHYPRFYSLSEDSMHLSLKLYECWGCESDYPEYFLVNTNSFETKNIGQLSYFKWLENGNYEYKELVRVPCDHEIYDYCEKPFADLPMLYGKF